MLLVVSDTTAETTMRMTMTSGQRDAPARVGMPLRGWNVQENVAMLNRRTRRSFRAGRVGHCSCSPSPPRRRRPRNRRLSRPPRAVRPSRTRSASSRTSPRSVWALQLEGKEIAAGLFARRVSGDADAGSRWSATITEFQWAPANFFHQPLYFDDTPLERYGQSVCPHLQPIISGGRFLPDAADHALQDRLRSPLRLRDDLGSLSSRRLCALRHAGAAAVAVEFRAAASRYDGRPGVAGTVAPRSLRELVGCRGFECR